MNETSPQEGRLFEEAADLMIRLQNDPGNPVSRQMVKRWRARGPAYERAWLEVSEIHGLTGRVLAPAHRVEPRSKPGMTRRSVVAAGLAGAGALAGGYLALPGLVLRARADHLTGTAEIRRIALPDGGTATLGPDSAIALHYDDRRREVALLAGMAFFEVAKDPSRPFRATTSEMTATALGTAFDLSNDAGLVSVSVEHGLVEIDVPGSGPADGNRLAAGQWATFDEGTRLTTRGNRDARQIGAWRSGQILVENEPVRAVVAKIARWQAGRVVIADAGLGANRISGVFDPGNPLRALEAVVHPFGARVRSLGPYLTVISSV